MKIEITEQAVVITEISDSERAGLETALRSARGQSLIIPRKPIVVPPLTEDEELRLMIDCIRPSAQDTLSALRRRGVGLSTRLPS